MEIYSQDGKKKSTLTVSDAIWNVKVSTGLVHQAVRTLLSNRRNSIAHTKTRGEVRGGGKKPWKQKGTGRARHGARTANLFVGGGVAHGPKLRSYRKSMPLKMRRLALRSALSAKAAEGAIIVVDGLRLDAPKTQTVRRFIDQACNGASALVLLAAADTNVERSIRNLADVRYLRAGYLNVRDLLGYERLVLPLEALDAVVAHLGRGDAEGGKDDA